MVDGQGYDYTGATQTHLVFTRHDLRDAMMKKDSTFF